MLAGQARQHCRQVSPIACVEVNGSRACRSGLGEPGGMTHLQRSLAEQLRPHPSTSSLASEQEASGPTNGLVRPRLRLHGGV